MNEKETSEELQLIAKRLRKARKEKGLTQLELSLQAGISQNMVACIEAGKRNPTFQTLIRMCRALDGQFSTHSPQSMQSTFSTVPSNPVILI